MTPVTQLASLTTTLKAFSILRQWKLTYRVSLVKVWLVACPVAPAYHSGICKFDSQVKQFVMKYLYGHSLQTPDMLMCQILVKGCN